MIWKVVTLVSVALGVLAHEPAISEVHMKRHDVPIHRGHHGELGHIGHGPMHHEEYAWSYPSYEYAYRVHDPHTGDNHGHAELRMGDEVKGEYFLVEPDGNKRVVKYHADKTGFHAQVHNSGMHHHIHEPKHHAPIMRHEMHEPIRVLEPMVHHPVHYQERMYHEHPQHHRVHLEDVYRHRERDSHGWYLNKRYRRDDNKEQAEQNEA